MRRQNLTRLALLVAVVLAVLSLPSTPAGTADAAEWRSDGEVVIAEGEIVAGDLVVAADRLVIAGVVQGDVFGYAYRAQITGAVEGDVLLAGQELTLTGTVEDDLRAAFVSMRVVEGARVRGDVAGAGFAFALDADSAIDGDLWYAGYQADVVGSVGGALHADVAALALRGRVARDVDARVQAYGAMSGWPFRFDLETPVEPLRPGLTFGETASIGGKLAYASPEPFEVPERAATGGVAYSEADAGWFAPSLISTAYNIIRPAEARGWAGTLALGWLALFLSRLLTFIIVGLVVLWRAPRLLRVASDQLRKRSLVSLFLGLAALIAAPFALAALALLLIVIVGLLTVISMGGLSAAAGWAGLVGFGGLTAALYIVAGFIAPLVVMFAVGQYLVARVTQATQPSRVAALLVGVAAFVIIWQIPLFGECFNCLSVMLGVGALFFYWRLRNRAVEEDAAPLAWLEAEPEMPPVTPPQPSTEPLSAVEAPGAAAPSVAEAGPEEAAEPEVEEKDNGKQE